MDLLVSILCDGFGKFVDARSTKLYGIPTGKLSRQIRVLSSIWFVGFRACSQRRPNSTSIVFFVTRDETRKTSSS